jgi:hypothetical protein
MSEMETVIGKIKKVDTPEGFTTKEKVDWLIKQGYSFDMQEYEMDFYSSDELVKVGKDWYEWISKKELDPYGDSEATLNEDGSINFFAHWYNGGGSLEEVLESTINNMEQ